MTASTVRAAQAGDPAAFEALVREHAGTVCAISAAITRDPVRAEEVAQEVFVQAWAGLRGLRNPDSFAPWLRQLTRNRAHDALRRVVRRREDGADALVDRADPHADPHRALDTRQREAALWEALDQLPADHREVLILFYREGRSVKQVASLLELQPTTVRKRLSRARDVLRADVADRLGEQLARTAPGAAFVGAVTTAIAAAAPSTAHAAGAVIATGLKGVAAGAAAGGAAGLAGVWLGRWSARGTPEDQSRLTRHAWLQTAAVLAAVVVFALLPPLSGAPLGMAILTVGMGSTVLAWPPGAGLWRRAAGLAVGLACGLGGAVLGLAASGDASVPLALALHLQVLAFVAVPPTVGLLAAWHLDLPRRWWALGALSWIAAAPGIAAGPPVAAVVLGATPLAGAIGLSLAAGLFEETARLGLYAALTRWVGPLGGRHAVVLGLGHGGIEALLFGAGLLAALSAGQVAEPWVHAGYGLSRLALLACHVGLTLMVWRAVRQRSARWWVVAVLTHVGLDLAAFAVPILWPAGGLAVGALAIVGLALWSMREAVRVTRPG